MPTPVEPKTTNLLYPLLMPAIAYAFAGHIIHNKVAAYWREGLVASSVATYITLLNNSTSKAHFQAAQSTLIIARATRTQAARLNREAGKKLSTIADVENLEKTTVQLSKQLEELTPKSKTPPPGRGSPPLKTPPLTTPIVNNLPREEPCTPLATPLGLSPKFTPQVEDTIAQRTKTRKRTSSQTIQNPTLEDAKTYNSKIDQDALDVLTPVLAERPLKHWNYVNPANQKDFDPEMRMAWQLIALKRNDKELFTTLLSTPSPSNGWVPPRKVLQPEFILIPIAAQGNVDWIKTFYASKNKIRDLFIIQHALPAAINGGHKDCVEHLIENQNWGANTNKAKPRELPKYSPGEETTLVAFAEEQNQPEIAKLLADKGFGQLTAK